MPNSDGSLKNSEKIMLRIAADRVISVTDDSPSPSDLGIVDSVISAAMSNDSARKSLTRVVEAMNLDMLAQAVGGWAAMSSDEQTHSLLLVEHALPEEFSAILNIVREWYYSHEQTPERPDNFDAKDELFGKVVIEEAPRGSQSRERRSAR
jgi:hypothetical protein